MELQTLALPPRRLVEARYADEITQLEVFAGTTQRAAVDYAIERSDFRDCFPGFAGGRGTSAARLAAARRFSRLAMFYLLNRHPLMPDDCPGTDPAVIIQDMCIKIVALKRLRFFDADF
jgi:hypothetical protein